MKNIIFTLILIVSASLLPTLSAQQIPISNRYVYNGKLFNPAATGVDGGQVAVNYRRQFTELEGDEAPSTILLNADISPLIGVNKIGLGVNLLQDNVGFTSRTDLSLLFAYHLVKTENVLLSAGIKAGYLIQRMNYQDIKGTDARGFSMDDPILVNGDVSTGTFNGGPGLFFRYTLDDGHALTANLSVPQLFTGDLDYGDGNTYVNDMHLMSNISFRYNVSEGFGIEPHFMARGIIGDNELKKGIFDLGLRGHFAEVLWVGLGYRSDDAGIYGSIGVLPTENLELFVSVETQAALGLTFEVGGAYLFGMDQKGFSDPDPDPDVEVDPGLGKFSGLELNRMDGEFRSYISNSLEASEQVNNSLAPKAFTNVELANNKYDEVAKGRITSKASMQLRLEDAYKALEDAESQLTQIENQRLTAKNNLDQAEEINNDVLERDQKLPSGKEIKDARKAYDEVLDNANTLSTQINATRSQIELIEREKNLGKFMLPDWVDRGSRTDISNYFQRQFNKVENLPFNTKTIEVEVEPDVVKVEYAYPDDVLEYNVEEDLPQVRSMMDHIGKQIQDISDLGLEIETINVRMDYQGDLDDLEDELDFRYGGEYAETLPLLYDLVELNDSGREINRQNNKRVNIRPDSDLTLESLAGLKLYGILDYLLKKQSKVTYDKFNLEITAPNSNNLNLQVNRIQIIIRR